MVLGRRRASTPRGCIWNHLLVDVGEGVLEASTPRGCIWNRLVKGNSLSRPKLQPHEGASGTATPGLAVRDDERASTPRGCIWNDAILGDDGDYSELQPHEGASGTSESHTFMPSCSGLQPHEGASGTHRRARRYRAVDVASTPRGCIWNQTPTTSDARLSSFNPTRVHLERLSWTAFLTSTTRFNPTRVHLERLGV